MGAQKAADIEMARVNFITGLILIASSLLAIFWLIPAHIEVKGEFASIGLSPRFFPYIAAVTLLILSIMLAVGNMLKMRKPEKLSSEESEENEVLGFGVKEINNCLVMAAGVAIYMLMLTYMEFVSASAIMMAVSMYITKNRGPILLPLIAIGFPWAMKILFWYTLEVTLP